MHINENSKQTNQLIGDSKQEKTQDYKTKSLYHIILTATRLISTSTSHVRIL